MRSWRKMRKPFLAIVAIILIVLAQVIISAPVRKSIRVQLNADYVRAMGAYKRLEPRLPRDELRVITTLGILNGARQAELLMERNLVDIVRGLLFEANELNDDELVAKVQNIEKQLARDHRALLILTSAMDLVTGAKDVFDFKADMQQTLQQIRRQSVGDVDVETSQENTEQHDKSVDENNVAERVGALRRQILQQVRTMKALIDEKVTETLDYLITKADKGSLLEQASKKVVRKRNAVETQEVPAEVRMIESILNEGRFIQIQEDFRNNLVDARLDNRNNELTDDSLEEDFAFPSNAKRSKIVIENRSNQKTDSKPTLTTTTATTTTTIRAARATKNLSTRKAKAATTTISPNPTISQSIAIIDVDGPKLAKQEDLEQFPPIAPLPPIEPLPPPAGNLDADDDFPDAPPPPDVGGGGLVGIITSLSGGEGGSDIGALIGALTGVISTLFGPGGLDIESLISTATSLISGLLAGNKNFGTVLGIYIGTAFDGLSGGGGAVNNGQFIGNLLGTVYAQLSADPEDDDARPNPFLFARNLISSFIEAKNRKESDEEDGDERRSDARHSHGDKGKGDAGGGSDSGGFIKHIASHIVGSLVNLILNASLGASGGASHASASLFGSSSHKGGGGGGQKH
ncbi:uncharacterized protein LOC126758789 [Bactrocera neohumeralis]|uniref:uncharacterized protein LOC120775774 n=1 Tax=Bactrocera tryoni TaxID=59916 RepID=UPI001A98BC10|nr:uncharacterized protein LOC120775774 [Bactrocera tryoni]XP_050329126.1 uncharacterized protein LOC126758789 [Bactrocera neohumeralis]